MTTVGFGPPPGAALASRSIASRSVTGSETLPGRTSALRGKPASSSASARVASGQSFRFRFEAAVALQLAASPAMEMDIRQVVEDDGFRNVEKLALAPEQGRLQPLRRRLEAIADAVQRPPRQGPVVALEPE